jgi:uncharacterized protein
MWTWIIAAVALLLGIAIGFFIGLTYLRKQMERMQSNPDMLQKMAKQMGYNMSPQQMKQAQKMMRNQKWK